MRSFNNGGEATHLTGELGYRRITISLCPGQGYSSCVRREAGYCSICWAASVFQLSLQTGDAGESGARGMSEHDKDCGRQFIPDDTVQPLYAGFQDFIEIPQGRCVGQGTDTDSIDRLVIIDKITSEIMIMKILWRGVGVLHHSGGVRDCRPKHSLLLRDAIQDQCLHRRL